MIKTVFDAFSGLRWTIVAGVFLVFSLIAMLAKILVPVDPAWVTVVISGFPLAYLAITRLLFQRWVSSALLITIAMIASIALGELFAAGEVTFIMAIGAILEERTVEKAKKGLKKLINLAPQQGRRLNRSGTATTEEMVSIEAIHQGDVLRVLPGEAIPVDGEILLGNTSIDQSIITGESLPVDKTVGDNVYCGTINRLGSVEITATKIGEDSSLQKLIRMVQGAENNKAPMQRIVDKWATWLVPIALVIALLAYVGTGDIVRAVTVLVVFCPCALALATPTSIMAAIGQATKYGVLIKSGDALEKMGKVDCIAFDKTGTLTFGNLAVSDVVPLADGCDEKVILEIAASAESHSEHPLGKAIVARAKEDGLSIRNIAEFEMVPGKGIKAVLDGDRVVCGNIGYLEENGVAMPDDVLFRSEVLRKQGKAAIFVAKGKDCIGIVALSDTIRPASKQAVQELRDIKNEVVLLTGDNALTAAYFADQVGITNVRAELLPAQKVESIKEFQDKGYKVCMIGDGVNDAPALKTASVGVAMGTMGSDVAVDAADIALMGDDVAKIPYLKRLSNATIKSIKVNITMSMALNFIAIGMSVMGMLTPITGALVHNAGSVLVVMNAALLYDRKYI